MAFVGATLAWSLYYAYWKDLEVAHHHAVAAFEKDLVYRRWATMHGGVYVEATPHTPPNPYLAHLPERDITTPSGRSLTLMNPAYMTREVYQLGSKQYGLRGHITSLTPLRPENAPDPWESRALRAFEQGEKEVSSIVKIDGSPYLRFMRPMITEEGCLKCHGIQGYKVGDIRGGISVSVPLAPLRALSFRRDAVIASAFVLLGLAGVGGIVLFTRHLGRYLHAQKYAEIELARAKAAAEAANKAKSDFLASMRHELRTPLGAIIGFSEGLLERADRHPLNDHQKDRIEKIYQSGEYLLSLINDILDLAKVESGTMEVTRTSFDVDELVGEVQAIAMELARSKPNVEIRKEVAPDLPPITSDREKLKQILVNLAGNAVKFTDEGSVTLAARRQGSQFVLSVTDTGAGIPANELHRVFEKFHQVRQTTSRPAKGTGLGLTICKQYADLLGGSISVSSEVGGGTTFELRFPESVASTAEPALASAASGSR